MLRLSTQELELFDDNTNEFITLKPQSLQLEHSLKSISKWEEIFYKSWFSAKMTDRQFREYVRCMTMNKVDTRIYRYLTDQQLNRIREYIAAPMSATTIVDRRKPKATRKTVTSELIYAWMVSYQIPFDPCQNWHYNRLFNLIKICEIEQNPPPKRSQKDIIAEYAEMNAERKKRLGTSG